MGKEPIVTIILCVITIFLASNVLSSENFVFGTYNPTIDICKGEVVYDTMSIYNTGNYLSDYTFTLDTPELSNYAKISTNSFSLYPGQNGNVTIRFQMPLNIKTGEYNFELSLITALENKKTLRYILNVKDCPLSDYSSINKNYTVNACEFKTIPITLFNKKSQSINYTSRYELPFAYMTKKVVMQKNSSFTYNVTFFVPCDKNGTTYMQYNLTAGQTKRNILIPVTIVPHAFYSIYTKQKAYTICGNNKVSIPLTITNEYNDNAVHTVSLSLNNEAMLLASLDVSKVIFNNTNEKTVNINVRPVFFPKDSIITITGIDDKKAIAANSLNITFKSQGYCDLPNLNVKNDSVTINANQIQNYYIDISNEDIGGYNQKDNVTYKLSSSPWQTWAKLSDNLVTVKKGQTKRVYLNLNPTNKTVARTYEFNVLAQGDSTKNTKTVYVTVSQHKGQNYFSSDNLYYTVYKYRWFVLIGILLGIIIVIILLLMHSSKPTYRIIKKGDTLKKQAEKNIEKIDKISERKDSLDSANDLDTLLGVIEVEKKAREKIIQELENWSDQYEELQKERQNKELRNLKSKQEILKEYKDINELLKIQKDSYANLKKREDQLQKAVSKRKNKNKKGFFANLFNIKNNDDFVSLEEVKKRGKKVKEEKIVERVQKTSKKDKNTVGNKLKQFFDDDEE